MMTSSPFRVGFGKRLLAVIIELALIFLIGFLIGLPISWHYAEKLGLFEPPKFQVPHGGHPFFILLAIGIALLSGAQIGIYCIAVINCVWECVTGAGIGKRILKIKILTNEGQKPTFYQLAARTVIKNIILVIFPISFLLNNYMPEGSVWISEIFDLSLLIILFVVFCGCFLSLRKNKQALHDILCETAIFSQKDAIVFARRLKFIGIFVGILLIITGIYAGYQVTWVDEVRIRDHMATLRGTDKKAIGKSLKALFDYGEKASPAVPDIYEVMESTYRSTIGSGKAFNDWDFTIMMMSAAAIGNIGTDDPKVLKLLTEIETNEKGVEIETDFDYIMDSAAWAKNQLENRSQR